MLDEDYFSGHEDVDFCWRLRKKGYKILYCPKAKVWHKVSRSMGGRFSPFNAYFLTRNKFIFASKHLNFLQKLFFLLYMYLVFPIRSLAYYLLNRSPGSLKGVYHAYVWHISGKQYYIDLPKPIKVVRVGSL
ncbi:MAG: hypothetical protein DDT40_00695 [candidate division WS2 bacterium]|nr:hypothetical protein [Candidatus Psychracetigena formicireducens]